MADHPTSDEIESFGSVWRGGYFEGDPLDPLGQSKYGRLGFVSVLHATYLACIRPYVHADSIVLEIGPGRGAWTKCLLSAREVWCLDAKSREDNGIDVYLGKTAKISYVQVSDFSCSMLPDDRFTYMFSFGTFCHISWDGLCQYARNIFPKLRSGANAFWLISDYDQRNILADNFPAYDIVARITTPGVRWLLERMNRFHRYRILGRPFLQRLDPAEPEDACQAGRWYNNGIARTCEMLETTGYRIVSRNVGTVPRDPIVHFIKP